MEALTRLVTESLARHGLNRPVDPRRLQWSRWSRCDSPHSLLVVPSKPGIFALAEEVAGLGAAQVETAADTIPAFSGNAAAPTAEPRRMLAVFQFSEADDMAFVLDRLFTRPNPLRERLAQGNSFLRFVVIEDSQQRRNTCTSLNHWLATSAEKATGVSADFTVSWGISEHVGAPLDDARQSLLFALPGNPPKALEFKSSPRPVPAPVGSPGMSSGVATHVHCPQPLPSGF